MKIDTALANVAYVCVDSSPYIYYVDQNPHYLALTRNIFRRVTQGQLNAFTSTIALSEVLVYPIKQADLRRQNAYRRFLLNTKYISIVSVDTTIALKAAELRAKYGLRTPDALHIATAIMSQCDAFLTNDRGLMRVTEIPILVLDDLEV